MSEPFRPLDHYVGMFRATRDSMGWAGERRDRSKARVDLQVGKLYPGFRWGNIFYVIVVGATPAEDIAPSWARGGSSPPWPQGVLTPATPLEVLIAGFS